MNICWFNHRGPKHPQAGGSEIHLFEICKRLVKMGHEVDVYCEKVVGLPATEYLEGIQFHRAGGKVTLHLIALWTCLRHSKNYDIFVDDIAHAVPWLSPLFAENVVAIVHHIHDKTVYQELGFPLGLFVFLLERLIPIVYRNKIIVTVSNSSKESLMEMHIPEKNIEVIHNGVDSKNKLNIAKSLDPLILHVGRIKKYKNQGDLVDIFSNVVKKIDDCKLVIAGGGSEIENLRKKIHESNLEDCIQLPGYVSLEEKTKLFNQAWVCVTASSLEGWSMAVLEAATCGTPTIAYNVHGLRDSIKNGETGFLIPYRDKDQYTSTLIEVLKNQQLRYQLSENAVKWSKKFRWDDSAKALFNILYATKYKLIHK